MRTILAVLVTALLIFTGCGAAQSNPTGSSSEIAVSSQESVVSEASSAAEPVQSSSEPSSNILIVYYSFTGTTREVANTLKDVTGGDLFEIQPDFDYNRSDIEDLAKKQIRDGFKPKLKNSVENFDTYDTIFVGTPVWWFSITPPVSAFLAEYDLKGKTVIPFCTCKDTYGKIFDQFKEACKDAAMLEGRNFFSDNVADKEKLKTAVEDWYKEIKASK